MFFHRPIPYRITSSLAEAILASAILIVAGCTTPAKLHTWMPAGLESARGQRILLSSVDGNRDWASELGDQMLAEQPADSATQFHLVDGRTYLSPNSKLNEDRIILASAVQNDPSDITTAQLASHLQADYELRGTVIDVGLPKEKEPSAEALSGGTPNAGYIGPNGIDQSLGQSLNNESQDPLDGQPLRVSWRIVETSTGQVIGGRPVVISLKEARERYPDLQFVEAKSALVKASAREAHRLFAPSVFEQPVTLAVSRVNLGARRVRLGNAAAIAGDWLTASKHYQAVLKINPFQSAALHNLALARVASQDFSEAKRLAQKAVRVQPNELHQRTLVWIEQQQRQYHVAFGLPDPPEGWHFTR